MREEYSRSMLLEKEAGSDPFILFERWFNEALQTEVEANICVLSTCSAWPTSRVILLKELKNGCFVFYTNYGSKKAQQMELNPKVSLLFFWQHTQRQVRILGEVTKVSNEESDAYFNSRPFDSQLGALASAQSQILSGREELDNKVEQLKKEYEGRSIPRPENWGGYAIRPVSMEFWQGRASRLHDRLLYTLQPNQSWDRVRLSP